MSPRSKGNTTGFSRTYGAALRKQLALKPGASLRPAARIGREALASGLDAVGLVKLHERALIIELSRGVASGSNGGMLKRASAFFVEALRPFESAPRPTMMTNGRWHRQNAMMGPRRAELAAIRRELKRETGLREGVQKALASSERRYDLLIQRSGRMQAHLRRLSHEILSAHEEERKKISRELHDEIGQTLTAVNVKLSALKIQAADNTKGLKTRIASTQRLVERSMHSVHRFARRLRPPLLDDLGLIPALHSYMKDFTKRTRIPIHFAAFAGVERLDIDKRTVLYRVAQEALTNVAKHARASRVNLTIVKLRGDVFMDVQDDGKAFSVERALVPMRNQRLGLLGMRERVEMVGGSFTVESEPKNGTTVRAQIPSGGGRRGTRCAPIGSWS